MILRSIVQFVLFGSVEGAEGRHIVRFVGGFSGQRGVSQLLAGLEFFHDGRDAEDVDTPAQVVSQGAHSELTPDFF